MDPVILVGGGAVAIAFMASVTTALSCFRKCGPNQAMIISGMLANEGGEYDFKIVKGCGAIVLPVVQQCAFLSLEVMTVEFHSDNAIFTANGTPISAECTAQIKISGDSKSIAAAAEYLLSKSAKEQENIAVPILEEQLRAVLSSLQLSEIQPTINSIAEQVQETAQIQLNDMGLKVVSFSIKRIRETANPLLESKKSASPFVR